MTSYNEICSGFFAAANEAINSVQAWYDGDNLVLSLFFTTFYVLWVILPFIQVKGMWFRRYNQVISNIGKVTKEQYLDDVLLFAIMCITFPWCISQIIPLNSEHTMWQMFFQAILRSLFIYGMRYRIIALALSLLINVLYPVIGLADTFQSASFYLQNLPMCWILVILIFHRETLAVDISSSDENTSHVPKGVMKEIIDNIPSGIIFYSEQNGIFEANRQWQNIQSQLRRANLRKKMPKSRLWKQNLSISEFSEREKTENTFKYFHNSENTKESLLDIVR